MSRITLGQYYPANTLLHRLDPRVKLLAVVVFVTTLLFVSQWLGLAIAAVGLSLTIYFSRVPLGFLFRGLRMIFFVVGFAMLLNIFLTPGENVLFSIGFIHITTEGIYRAFLMASRLVLLVVGSSLLTLTTSPIKLTDGIEALLRPTPLPAHDIAIMMTIALRMIPTLAEETDKIMKAQKARGADFGGGPIKRVRAFLPIMVPLFVSAFKRADELATAMEARCYRGGEGRTKLSPLRMQPTDWAVLVIAVVFCAGLLLTRFV
ncbi:MAG: energy-coupling factor transporter transmembrane protein EcfT [Defluviitaleaceae bacterium]|nr:energy-coupling factor transporter transmembrane protein EcfT [Defluviitaleaceae bacterium]